MNNQKSLVVNVQWQKKQALLILEEAPPNHPSFRKSISEVGQKAAFPDRDKPHLSDDQWLITQALTNDSIHIWHWVANVLTAKFGRSVRFDVAYVDGDFQFLSDPASAGKSTPQAADDAWIESNKSNSSYDVHKTFFGQWDDLLEQIRYRRRQRGNSEKDQATSEVLA